MTRTTNALEVDLACRRSFTCLPPWLNQILERKQRRLLRAVDDISFQVPSGGCPSLVGESGCGNSTVARLVTGLKSRPAPGRSASRRPPMAGR